MSAHRGPLTRAYLWLHSGPLPPPTKDRAIPNITYLTANGYDAKLDVYARTDTATLRPVLVNIHGGGWVNGTKEGDLFHILPWIETGWNVVNVEYRLARVSQAPAAVEDCLCALRWVAANAKTYGFDTARIVTTGGSAGGHLSLTAGMIGESDDLRTASVPASRSPSRSHRQLVRHH